MDINKLPKDILEKIMNLEASKLEKLINRIEKGQANRFETLRYNRFQQFTRQWERETAMKLLEENGITMPVNPKKIEDFTAKTIEDLKAKAQNGDQLAKTTLEEAQIEA